MKTTETKLKTIKGIVVSNKMDKTAVVSVTRFVKNSKYQKYVKHSKTYKAHDADNSAVVGASVEMKQVRPMSKGKHFMIVK